MKIVTILGARPQFVKAAVMSRCLKKEHDEVIVHTGQHFDANMSDIFFTEMSIPHPKYNLGVSGGSHAEMTGRMMMAIEKVLETERPDAVLLYGDTNSTVAGALSSVKLHIPILHIEAGNRLGSLDNPEEVNRIVTDHLSTLLFCAVESAKQNLDKEGLGEKSFFVGNVMYDAFLRFTESSYPWEKNVVDLEGTVVSVPPQYYYMTCHREENTSTDDVLSEILKAMNSLDAPTIYPVHPRNRQRVLNLKSQRMFENIIFTQPVGYLESVNLVKNAKKIVTDSGGLQCEAFYAGVQCVTVFKNVVWPETMVDSRNQLAVPDANDILNKLEYDQVVDPNYRPFGVGKACESIVEIINERLCSGTT